MAAIIAVIMFNRPNRIWVNPRSQRIPNRSGMPARMGARIMRKPIINRAITRIKETTVVTFISLIPVTYSSRIIEYIPVSIIFV